MAKCDQGYICLVCGQPVKGIHESSLYLHYVIGDLEPRALLSQHDQHLACNPQLTQYVVSKDFNAPEVEGAADKRLLNSEQRIQRERLITAGYFRLKFLHRLNLSISDYPFSPQEKARILQGELLEDSWQ